MSKNIKLASLSVAVVAGLFVAYWGGYQTAQIAEPTADIAHVVTDAPALAQTTRPQMSGEIPAINLDLAAWEAEYTAAVEADERAFIADWEARNVDPYNPQIVDCVGVDLSTSQDSCDTEYQFPRHPYYSYTDAALESLVYSDPLAAQILAARLSLSEPRESLNLSVHSAAISAKPGPLMAAAHGTFRLHYPKRKMSLEDVFYHAALLRIAKKMGNQSGIELNLPDGVSLDEKQLDGLVEQIESKMIHTQITVSGDSSLKELFDA